MRVIPLLTTSLLVMVVSATTSNSCSCIATTVQERFQHSDAIFTGTVIDRWEPVRNSAPGERNIISSGDPVGYRIVVSRTYKGDTPDTVMVWTAAMSVSCGVEFQLDSTYLVYAHTRDDLSPTTSTCSGTTLTSWAAGDLKYLQGQ